MAYYLSKRKTRGVQYLTVIEHYIEEVDGKKINKQRTIQSFGRLDKLLEEDPLIEEKLIKKYKININKKIHEETVRHILSSVSKKPGQENSNSKGDNSEADTTQIISSGAKENDDTDVNTQEESEYENVSKHINQILYDLSNIENESLNITLNYGLWALKPIWEDWLCLKYKINYIQENFTDIEYDTNKILSYLTYLKIIDPSSHLHAYANQSLFLNSPLSEVKLHEIYRALGFASEYKDDILTYVNSKICRNYKRDLSLVFYDCSNFYFETPYDDKQKIFSYVVEDIKSKYLQLGYNLKDIETKIFNGELQEEIDREYERLTEEFVPMRMRGMSKEHRFDLPLVSIALVIDNRGIPVDFKIFPGNTSEYKTMPVLVKEMKEKYGIKNSIVVADRGLNSADNIANLLANNLGFVVAQKVSNLKDSEEEIMLKHEGYKPLPASLAAKLKLNETENACIKNDCIEDSDTTKDKTKSGSENNINDSETGLNSEINSNFGSNDTDNDPFLTSDCLYKRTSFKKIGYTKATEEENRKKVIIDCEIIYTFSKKRQARDLKQLELDVTMAQKAVAEHKDMTPTCSSGWRSLVRVKKEILDTEPQKTETEVETINTENNTNENQNQQSVSAAPQNSKLNQTENNNSVSDKKDSSKDGSKNKKKGASVKKENIFVAEEIKKDVIEARRRRAGYAAMIYRKPDELEKDLTDDEILGTYTDLIKIEECFRIMKSNFSIRPMFVRNKTHIEGHCTICVLALIMLRLLKMKLKENKYDLSLNQISNTLFNSRVSAISGDGRDGFFLNLSNIDNMYSLDTKKIQDTDKLVSKWMENNKDFEMPINKILKTVGLKPLKSVANPKDICSSLKIRADYITLVGAPLAKLQETYMSQKAVCRTN